MDDLFSKYRLSEDLMLVYKLFWDEFSSWYLEMIKPAYGQPIDKKTYETTLHFFDVLLRQLHPFMPFITEEIFCTLQSEEESIMISAWPVYKEEYAFAKEEKEIETMKEAIRGIRNVRTSMNVAPSRKASVYVVSENADIRAIFENGKLFFAPLAYASEVLIQADKTGIADDADSVVIDGATQ